MEASQVLSLQLICTGANPTTFKLTAMYNASVAVSQKVLKVGKNIFILNTRYAIR
jgi:hypothetical protein